MRRRASSRGLTPLELAVAISVLGCALAATVPACIHAVHTARTAEAVENVEKLLRASIQRRNDDAALPSSEKGAPEKGAPPRPTLASAPLTPSIVPRGSPASDPDGTWDHPTWKAIGFSLDAPHWYSYQLDVDPDSTTALRAIAHGDLDGDGVLSTFERTATRDGATIVPQPGLVVTNELE